MNFADKLRALIDDPETPEVARATLTDVLSTHGGVEAQDDSGGNSPPPPKPPTGPGGGGH